MGQAAPGGRCGRPAVRPSKGRWAARGAVLGPSTDPAPSTGTRPPPSCRSFSLPCPRISADPQLGPPPLRVVAMGSMVLKGPEPRTPTFVRSNSHRGTVRTPTLVRWITRQAGPRVEKPPAKQLRRAPGGVRRVVRRTPTFVRWGRPYSVGGRCCLVGMMCGRPRPMTTCPRPNVTGSSGHSARSWRAA